MSDTAIDYYRCPSCLSYNVQASLNGVPRLCELTGPVAFGLHYGVSANCKCNDCKHTFLQSYRIGGPREHM